MNSLIKRSPYTFGLILLLGIISVIYLILFGVGVSAQTYGWILQPSAFKPGVSIFYKLVATPFIGFCFCLFALACVAAFFLIANAANDLCKAAHNISKSLGNWLLKSTASPHKKG